MESLLYYTLKKRLKRPFRSFTKLRERENKGRKERDLLVSAVMLLMDRSSVERSRTNCPPQIRAALQIGKKWGSSRRTRNGAILYYSIYYYSRKGEALERGWVIMTFAFNGHKA